VEPLELAEILKKRFPGEVVDIVSHRGQVSVIVKRERILEILENLRDDPTALMNHLMDLCGVDYLGKKENRFEVVYNLYSIPLRHSLRVRALVPEDDPRISSVTSLWRGADWHERETYDLYGIVFEGHPDHRRILLPEDWEGYPLRKDYPLPGPKTEWHGYEEVKEFSKRLRKYDFSGSPGEA